MVVVFSYHPGIQNTRNSFLQGFKIPCEKFLVGIIDKVVNSVEGRY